MGRKPTNKYESTPFSRRICQLQEQHGYSDQEVIAGVVDDNGNPLITGEQAYGTHKTGRSQPNNLQDMLRGYARFYDVSVDYLLELTDSPTPEIGSVQEITGLCEQAIRRLKQLKDQYPDILAMVNAIIAGVSEEDVTHYINLYQQIYDDYVDTKQGVRDSAYDIIKMQKRFFQTQSLYNYWQSIVIDKLASQFDSKMFADTDRREYEQSQEYLDTITNLSSTFTPDDSSNE